MIRNSGVRGEADTRLPLMQKTLNTGYYRGNKEIDIN